MDIWTKCRDRISPETMTNKLIRIVESQEQIATNNLVEDLEEQNLLEQMLEDTKPVIPAGAGKLHFLLATPFRYPPLKHGSRFGTRFESGLFYGSHTLTTAFAETAYYRFLFWYGMSLPPPSGKFVTQHTVFAIEYATDKGFKLQNKPFNDYEQQLIDPGDYSATQELGQAMRDFGIEAFEFKSARDQDHGLNAALFSPTALVSRQVLYQQQWLCDISPDRVSFYSYVNGNVYKYPLNSFMVNGRLPEPAT